MTLPSRHRILNSCPGGLRSSTIPLGRGGSPQYLRLMTPKSLGSKFHHLRTSCNLSAKVGDVLSCFWSVTLTERQPSTKALETSATIMEIQVYIRREGGGGQGIQCRRFFATDVVPVHLTIYSLSRLIRKMSDIYPSSHFVWHPVPPVPWCNFNAGILPFLHGKETVSHCDRPGISLWAQWQHCGNIKHWSVPLLHQHMCLTFFSKFQHVVYQDYFSLIVMYKTVFSSHHVDVVSMTETAGSWFSWRSLAVVYGIAR